MNKKKLLSKDKIIIKKYKNMLKKMELRDQQILIFNKQLKARNQQLKASGQQLRASERRIQEREEKLLSRNVFLNSVINSHKNILVFALDKNYRYVAFNESHRQEMKKVYNADIELGRHILDYITILEVKSLAKASFDRALSGKSFIEVQQQPNLDIFYEFNWSPMKSSNGKIIGITAFIRNITERMQIDSKLSESAMKYKTLFENTNSAILIADVGTGIILDANKYAENLFGRSREELIGINRLQIHPSDKTEYYQKEFQDHIKQKNVNLSESIVVKKDGTQVPVQITAAVMEIHGKKVIQGIFHDITKQKNAEKEKEAFRLQLEQIQKMEVIGTLAGGIAHDFNNILTAIKGYAELARMNTSRENPVYDDLNEIGDASDRAAELTKQLLIFSRKQPMLLANVNINRICGNLSGMLKRIIGEDIKINTYLQPDLWMIEADESQIGQIIMNLSVNAKDSMPKGGILAIKTENVIIKEEELKNIFMSYPGKFIRLSIEDNGIGMDKETIRHIYEPFFTTKALGKGTGLGLSVVHGIAEQHKGWVNVYSEVGIGTIFKIYLPAYFEKEEIIVRKKIQNRNLKGNGERILYVEDEEKIRTFTSKILSLNGYIIIEAKGVKEALEIYKKEKGNFNLVLTDVILTDKTGIELVNQLTLDKPSLKVVFTSGYFDDKSQWENIHNKGYEFVQKPYESKELLAGIRNVLDKK